MPFLKAHFKTPHLAQSLHQAQILILEIRHVFLWLIFSPSLTLDKLKRFETGSFIYFFTLFFAFFLTQSLSSLTIAQSMGFSYSLQFAWLYKGHSGYCFDTVKPLFLVFQMHRIIFMNEKVQKSGFAFVGACALFND